MALEYEKVDSIAKLQIVYRIPYFSSESISLYTLYTLRKSMLTFKCYIVKIVYFSRLCFKKYN